VFWSPPTAPPAGIDVTSLSHVVNFDVPKLPEDYIDRVGRTARMEAEGDAITLVSSAEDADFRMVERAVGTRIRRVTLPDFDDTPRITERPGVRASASSTQGRATADRVRASHHHLRRRG
jgi:ATP-dependent RNA helicase RhlE